MITTKIFKFIEVGKRIKHNKSKILKIISFSDTQFDYFRVPNNKRPFLMNEKQLIEACCKMDQKAQRLLFDRYYKAVFRLAKRYLVDHHETEDLVVVVFNKVLKNIINFEYRGEGSLLKWLNTITINESIRAMKKIRSIHFKEDVLENTIVKPTNYSGLDIEKVNAIIAKMPKGYRNVFNLYAIDGYSHSEIAEALNISRNTSKSQLRKARKFIINELNKDERYGT